MKPLIISTLSVVLIALLLAQCDMRSPEVREAERIKTCQEMIKNPAPVMPDNLSGKERNAFSDRVQAYEKCRKLIEDRELPGEIKRFPNDFDFKNYTYIKVGGKFIKIPRSVESYPGILIPHIWQYDYPAGEGRSPDPPIKAGTKGQVYFSIRSTKSLAFEQIKNHAKIILDYKEICEKSKLNPELRGGFIWNDIFFGLSLVSRKQGKQEWDTICPEAVKIVSQFEEIPLQPQPTPTKP